MVLVQEETATKMVTEDEEKGTHQRQRNAVQRQGQHTPMWEEKGFEGTVVWVESVLPGGEVGTLDRRNRDPRLGWTWPGTRSIWPPTWRQVGKHQGQQGPD